jgi:hypothetical protein
MALPADRAIPEEKFPERLRKLIARDAPAAAQMMIARGQVPMPPPVLLSALYQLTAVADVSVAEIALETALRQPIALIEQAAREPLLPVVLDWLATTWSHASGVLDALAANRATDDDTVVRLAEVRDESLCETIARNQARCFRTPTIIERLYYNPALRASTADRMIEDAARAGVDLSALPGFDLVLQALRGEGDAPPTQAPRSAADDAAADEAMRAIRTESEQWVQSGAVNLEDEADLEQKSESLSARIGRLNISQKIRLALLGNAMERALLMRTPNKMVQRAVIRSPAISDQEAMVYAQNRSLPDEIIAYIASSKQWTRHYHMKLLLVKNPKTPVGTAMTFLRMLRSADMRLIARDRNVSPMIAKAAKNLLTAAR